MARKTFRDILSERKFILVFGLFFLMVIVASLEGAKLFLGYTGMEGEYGLSSLPIVMGQLADKVKLIGGLLALVISFDMINGEVDSGSLKVLLSYPIYRDQVLVGKYLGGLGVIVLATVLSLMAGLGIFVGITSMAVSFDILSRLLIFVVLSIIYMSIFLGVGILFSSSNNGVSESLLSSIAVWIVSLFILSSIGSLAVALDPVNPIIPQISERTIGYNITDENVSPINVHDVGTIVIDDFEPTLGMKVRDLLDFVSPSMSYQLSTYSLMQTSEVEFGNTSYEIISLSIETCIQRILGNLLYLFTLPLILFAVNYVVFNRMEIS